MSLRPLNLGEYSKGLRKPSGRLDLKIRKSLTSETMPTTVWMLAVSWVLVNGQGRAEAAGKGERRTESEQIVLFM